MATAGLVSFVMPVWSPNPDWLDVAITSVLREEGCELELLVVDDGCPAPVEGLLGARADERLRVLRIPHAGVAAARNAGLAEVRGEFVRFVDCDDVVSAGSTSRLVALSGGRYIAYGATLYCDEQLRPLRKLATRLQGDLVTACLLGRFDVRLGSLLFPRRVVEATGAWDETFAACSDWDFVLRALEHAEVRGDEEVCSLYRKYSGSVSASPGPVEAGAALVVRRFFERRPEAAGSLRRKASARVALIGAQMRRADRRAYARRLARVARLDPALALGELASVPGRMRSRLSRAR